VTGTRSTTSRPRNLRESHQVVHSPEQHRFDLPLAGPTSRILAYGIDYVAILLIGGVAIALLLALFPIAEQVATFFAEVANSVDTNDPNSVYESSSVLILVSMVIVLQLAIEWVYFVVLELTTGGRSLGKAVMKLRVVGDGGHPLRLGQSVARNLLRSIDILPGSYLIGLISMIASSEAKRLGDLAAGTVVIRLDRPAAAPPLVAEPDASTDAFRFAHQQVARLGSQELRLVRQTLRRLPELSPDQARQALDRSVHALIARIEHPPVPAEEHEAFLRALLLAVDRGNAPRP
jgi:uncharacterized RDD family membrane protein YckC